MTSPPGQTTQVDARRVLVLAPHYDDEVLGCGGLLSRLVQAGAQVQVLFLTDGAGGHLEPAADPAAYQRTRYQEAEAVAARLGFAGIRHLDLPDGGLELRRDELAKAYEEALLAHQPDLLLVPSPLEVSGDHRAAFAALHDLLAPLRGGGELDRAASGMQVLVYEVNHPLYPQLLVDVSDRLDELTAAMEIYASQQQRHDYLAAALGLRRFRTLSLGPEVKAAEGYVRLAAADFARHSHAQLVRRLGGVPELLPVLEGPRISVVVRTHNRPQLLAEALGSLAAGSYRQVEVVVVNDGGTPPQLPADFPFPLVRVDLSPNRGRAGAAAAGVERASGDYVCFLDDDDLTAPEHLATLAGLVNAADVRVAYTDAAVAIYQLDEHQGWHCVERRLPYSRDFDPDVLRLDNYIPFNTLLFERQLLLELDPLFDPELPFFEDWDLLIRLAERVRFHHLPRVTCEYRHFRGAGHHIFGQSPRERPDFLAVKTRVLAKHAAAHTPESLARAVDVLRREAVQAAELGQELERSNERQRQLQATLNRHHQAYTLLEERYVRTNGELEALSGDHRRLQLAYESHSAEIGRLQAEELRINDERQQLQAAMAAQAAELARVYDEEQKLTAVAREHSDKLGRALADVERLAHTAREQGAQLAQARAEVEGLQGTVREQVDHLARTYAEIERLNGLIRAMEGSRAWRLHRWLERHRPGSSRS